MADQRSPARTLQLLQEAEAHEQVAQLVAAAFRVAGSWAVHGEPTTGTLQALVGAVAACTAAADHYEAIRAYTGPVEDEVEGG